MKTTGLIGGTGWASSNDYYKHINELTNKRLGGLNYAKCILYSVNYGDIDKCNRKGDYEGVYSIIEDAALKLVSIGVDQIALCANTLHFIANRIQKEIPVPLIHIGDAVAKRISKSNITTVGLMGTLQTMQQDFYKGKLRDHDINTILPEIDDMEFINHSILNELFNREFKPTTKERFIKIMNDLKVRGAEAIVLGCTEIPLLIKQEDFDLPVFDTLYIHAQEIVNQSLYN